MKINAMKKSPPTQNPIELKKEEKLGLDDNAKGKNY